jgi:alpha-ribazole phosphatase
MAVKKFLLIRHSATQSNLERRYIGSPAEPLCPEGINRAKTLAASGRLPAVGSLISGPALRCRQTAELLFPGKNFSLCQMSEIDFGLFKGKNAAGLLGNTNYERWLETGCLGDIPGGESVVAFKEQCVNTFLDIAGASHEGTAALVIHGGNIMAILESLALPKQEFYAYHLPNCGFFLCSYEKGHLRIEKKGGP